MAHTGLSIPSLVRVKPGALRRLGIYLRRSGHRQPVVLASEGLPTTFLDGLKQSLTSQAIDQTAEVFVDGGSFEAAVELLSSDACEADAVIGLGGGKALDLSKYLAFLTGLPFYSVPTSLSNDGFCSPQSSLTIKGNRKALPSALPFGVVVDTEICFSAPIKLWHSGVGDLAAKLTAIADWKLAFHNCGTPLNDFAALLSDATVMQFIARPERDLEGLRLLATALMLNGIAIQIAGSSRPASGSEHLISHALDRLSARPRLHGLQVGVATYLVSLLQGGRHSERIAQLFSTTGFWDTVRSDPFDRTEWLAAVRIAPTLKYDFYCILKQRDCVPDTERLMCEDSLLMSCFSS